MIRGELFGTPMVKAFLNGNKNRTSRPIKPQPFDLIGTDDYGVTFIDNDCKEYYQKPKHSVGDVVYVRETWRQTGVLSEPYAYFANEPELHLIGERGATLTVRYKWSPSIHMPREAARLWFRVTDVKVQRLDDVTEQDAEQDGFISNAILIPDGSDYTGLYAYDRLMGFWRKTYPNDNWMWVYYLKPITKEEAET